jgi:hypothetical protein
MSIRKSFAWLLSWISAWSRLAGKVRGPELASAVMS